MPNGAVVPAPDPPAAREVRLSWRLSRHARRLLTMCLAGLFAAAVSRRPEFAGLAAPPLLLLAHSFPARLVTARSGTARSGTARSISVRSGRPAERVFEQEPFTISVSASGTGACHVRWLARPGTAIEPAGATVADGAAASFSFSARRWGRRETGTIDIVLRDPWRITEAHGSLSLPAVDVYPRPAVQRSIVVLSRLPNRLGEHHARASGEGVEFAAIREYVPGDRQRRINWAASTRRGKLLVNTYAAERSQDVVLLVDATSDVGEPGSSALDLALRGASASARAYLDARDRVGVIVYQWGGARWLAPGLGGRQYHKIVDTLLSADAGWSRGASFRRLPRAALPPGALVVVFSPLLDQRLVEALRELRERGFAMLVVDVLLAVPPARPRLTDRTARKLWFLEQDAIRFSLRELGVPVVRWDGESSLDLPLAPYTRRPLVARR